MKRRWLALLLILAFIVLSGCSSKGTIHKLWDIDVSTMSADQIMDYLKQKKGIETISRPDGFFSDPLSELTLYGYPYQLSFDSFDGENTISLDFSYFFDNESSLWDIASHFIDKYGKPNMIVYDITCDRLHDPANNYMESDHHDRIILDSCENFSLTDTMTSWPYKSYGVYPFIDLHMIIDNIEIRLSYVNQNVSFYWAYVAFHDSAVNTSQIKELHVHNSSGEYIDSGL